jgi:hypothetical protein
VPDPQHNFEPQTSGELLDRASRLYFRNFSLLLSMSAIFHLPLMAVEILRSTRNMTGTRVTFPGAMLELLATLISLLVIAPLTWGTTTKMVSDIYLGNTVTLTGALRAAWGKYGTLLKSQIIPVIAVLAGIVMFVVPGILWYLSYVFITPIVMNEGITRSRSVRVRSRDLVRGYRGKVFVILIVLLFIELLAQAGVRSMARFFISAAATTGMAPILNGSVAIVAAPMVALSITLLYYDLRIRKEGFDLEMLSRAVGNRETP